MSKKVPKSSSPPIAIVGVSALFPGSNDTDGFWRDILNGKDLIGNVPKEHWLVEDYYDPDPKTPDKTYANRGAFLDPIDFDALGWGIPPSIVPATDTAQLLALIVAERVLADASRTHEIDKSRTSVILGVTSAQELLGSMVSRLQAPVWRKSLREMGLPESQVEEACKRIAAHYTPWQEATFPGVLGNVVAGRIANRLNLGGTNCVTDAACASTFSALSMAVNELALGQSDLAIAGGVDTMNDIFMFMCFSKTPALSPSGDCRPFSSAADGTMLGEGLAMFALARLEDALDQGHRIYGVIRGVGGGSDGRAKSVYAPLADGQARTLRRAYDAAGYSPRTVELVEAHGTGTKAGDAAEFSGLTQVFGAESDNTGPWCALGSVKSQVGHTKAAAGAAGLFKALMAINEAVIPPSIKIEAPNPKLDLEKSPFHLSTRSLPWIRGSDHPRRASVSAFGFGGSNFHVALEAPPKPAPRRNTLSHEIVALSASSAKQLIQKISALKTELSPERFRFLARQSHQNFDEGLWRLVTVSADASELSKQTDEALAHLNHSNPESIYRSAQGLFINVGNPSPASSEVAFLFPGQGSQYVDMGAELALRFNEAREVWDKTADLSFEEEKLHKVVYPNSVFNDADRQSQTARLTQTQWAQPALGAVSLSVLALLKKVGLAPSMVGGHSFGELSALAAAGALNPEGLIKVARTRGELMAQAADVPGAMLAVSATLEKVREILSAADIRAEIANHNAPKQVVIAGAVDTIESAERAFKAAKLRSTRLPVATAFHSSIVAGAKPPFKAALDNISMESPTIPVFANVNAAPHTSEPAEIKQTLAEQLASPVRFVEMIEAMYAAGARVFVEVGPGSVLTSLVGRILDTKPHVAISTDRKGRSGYLSFGLALAEMAARGLPVRFSSLFEEYEQITDPTLKPKPKLALPISGANQGKPYPPKEGAAGRPLPNPEPSPAMREAPSSPSPATLAVKAGTSGPVHPPKAAPTPRIQQPAKSSEVKANHLPGAPSQVRSSPTGSLRSRPSAVKQPEPPKPSTLQTTTECVAFAPPPSKVRLEQGTGITSAAPSPTNLLMSSPKKPTPSPAWMTVWQSSQVAAAQTQATYQKAMADSHMAYLKMAETSLETLARLAQGTSTPPPVPVPLAHNSLPNGNGHVHQSFSTPFVPSPTVAPVNHLPTGAGGNGISSPSAPTIAPVVAAPAATTIAPPAAPVPPPTTAVPVAPAAPVPTAVPVAPAAPVSPPTAVPTRPVVSQAATPAQPKSSRSLEAQLREVVAEATGYPEDVLQSSMSLEADLGIDSIKRVEILSMVKKAVPELPELDAATLGALETLGDVAQHLQDAMGTAAPVSTAHATVPSATVTAPAAQTTSNVDLVAQLRAVVAEATGYPSDVLQEEMSLEADLGIDSIKRVEILSMVKKAVPELPELDAATLGALETLGDVAQHLQDAMGTAAPVSTAHATVPSATVTAPAAQTTPNVDLVAQLRAVVAEATGYPSDVLQEEMSLEADLGIDSIKRVEILSMVKKAVPELPELDAATLGALETLGDVAQHLQDAMGTAAPVSTAHATVSPTPTREPSPSVPSDYRYLPTWVPAPPSGMARIRPETLNSVAVVGGPKNIRETVTDRLIQAGYQAYITDAPLASDDGLVLLHGLSAVSSVEQGRKTLKDAFQSLRSAAGLFTEDRPKLLAAAYAPNEPDHWPLAGLAGLVKTAGLEAPALAAVALKLERSSSSPEELAEQLVREIQEGGLERDVKIDARGQRLALKAESHPIERDPHADLPFSERDVVVVSGGARGVTSKCILTLAKHRPLRFVLLGRTALVEESDLTRGTTTEADIKRALIGAAQSQGASISPAEVGREAKQILATREVKATLEAIQQAGSEALYLAVDVTDKAALTKTLADVRQAWGPVSGIIHAAGVIHDKRIVEKSDDQWDRVVETKLGGLHALTEATATDELKAWILFSSVAAFGGNVGQADYASANAALDTWAEQRKTQNPNLVIKSLAWGPWRGGMVSSALEAHFEAAGVTLIELQDGAQWMVDELKHPTHPHLVLGGQPTLGNLAPSSQEAYLNITVDPAQYPELEDHAVAGPPVIPVVMVTEWMLRALSGLCPGASHLSIEDLRVRRGISLDAWPTPETFTVTAKPDGQGAYVLSLIDTNHQVRYVAIGREVQSMPNVSGPVDTLPPTDTPKPYGGVLFHGPKFQALSPLERLGTPGALGQLADTHTLGWTPDVRRMDPARLDGALQLAVLVTEKMINGASLPTRIQRLVVALDHQAQGLGRAWSITRDHSQDQVVHDLFIEDGAGQVSIVVEGAETTRRPNWNPTV